MLFRKKRVIIYDHRDATILVPSPQKRAFVAKALIRAHVGHSPNTMSLAKQAAQDRVDGEAHNRGAFDKAWNVAARTSPMYNWVSNGDGPPRRRARIPPKIYKTIGAGIARQVAAEQTAEAKQLMQNDPTTNDGNFVPPISAGAKILFEEYLASILQLAVRNAENIRKQEKKTNKSVGKRVTIKHFRKAVLKLTRQTSGNNRASLLKGAEMNFDEEQDENPEEDCAEFADNDEAGVDEE